MTGLFDDILTGVHSSYVSESVQLSYEEEQYIDNNITKDPETLADYAAECFIGMNSAFSSITVMEAMAAVDIASGKNSQTVTESLADRASDAYDTIKRWATKIWKAIKKFANKVWNHIKNIKDRIVAFFTNNETVLRNVKGSFKVPWVIEEKNIIKAADLINELCALVSYDQLITKAKSKENLTDVGKYVNSGIIVATIVKDLRNLLYDNDKGEADYKKSSSWDTVKGEVLRVTKLGSDTIFRDFLNLGEKNYKEALDIENERVDDLKDRYDDIELKDNSSDAEREKYLDKRNRARTKIMLARAKLQLRQRGIQLLSRAVNDYYNQCAHAAKLAIRYKNGLSTTESYNPINRNDYNSLITSVMI